MPIRRWFFIVEEGSVYLYDTEHSDCTNATLIKISKSKTKQELGPVMSIETTEGKSSKISDKYGVVHGLVIYCSNGSVVLSRKLFVWNANDFCKRFKELKTALEFVSEWRAWLESHDDTSTELPPAKKACLMGGGDVNDEEKWMDDIDHDIEKHKVGKMDIVVSQLMPPQKERLLRKIDPNFIKALKTNMLRDPTGTGVPPAVVFTNQVSVAEFDLSLKDAYKYEVAGGLHGFTAKSELHIQVPNNPYYRSIEAIVYCKLSDEQALRLALRHNVNGHFIHKMTFRDIIEACRARLAAMSPTLKPSGEWRTTCKTVIIPEYVSKAYKNEMLRLSVVCQPLWDLYMKCFDLFESGGIKGQTLTSKQLMTKPEVKQTQFQCLLPLPENIQQDLLSKLLSQEVSLKELKKLCEKEKKLGDLQEKFANLTNCKDFKEAKKRFPLHSEKLEQFLSLNIKKSTPQAFSQFCAGAVMATQSASTDVGNSSISACTFVEVSNVCSIDPSIVTSSIKTCGGSLFMLYMDKETSLEICEKLVLTCCQINAPTVIESYNIVIYGTVEQVDMAKTALSAATQFQSILYCCNNKAVGDASAKGFTSNVTCAVVGHWSKDKSSSNHFNFLSHSNALMYNSKRSLSCAHSNISIDELLHQLISLLSFPGQTVVEFFPTFACGDFTFDDRSTVIVADHDRILCAKQRLHKEFHETAPETETEATVTEQ